MLAAMLSTAMLALQVPAMLETLTLALAMWETTTLAPTMWDVA